LKCYPWAISTVSARLQIWIFPILRAWRGLITGKAGTISNEYSSETTQERWETLQAYWLKLILLNKNFLDVLRWEEEEGQPLSFPTAPSRKKKISAQPS